MSKLNFVSHPHPSTGGNSKLRALVERSKGLLRRRLFKQALNNAQIAYDFASKSSEDPEVAFRAQLLIGEVYLINADYTFDRELRSRAWRQIEQVEADLDRYGKHPHKLAAVQLVKGELYDRSGKPADARRCFEEVLALDEHLNQKARTHALLGLARLAVAEKDANAAKCIEAGMASLEGLGMTDRECATSVLALLEGRNHLQSGRFGEAFESATHALQLARQNQLPEVSLQADYLIGCVSLARGNNEIALRFFYRAIDLAEGLNYQEMMARVSLSIGQVFDTLNHGREALSQYERALGIAQDGELLDLQFATAYAAGLLAKRQRDWARATGLFQLALTAARSGGLVREEARALARLTRIHRQTSQVGLAKIFCEQAEKILSPMAEAEWPADNLLARAELAFDDGEMEAALRDAIRCAELAAAAGYDQTGIDANALISECYLRLGDVNAALEYQRRRAEGLQGRVELHRRQQLPGLDMRAALRERERTIEELEATNRLQRELIEKTQQVERANHDLIQANEELRQFAYVTSHDLKEPVRQIGSYAGLIRRRLGTRFTDETASYFEYVSEGVSRLNRLLDSLMFYTSIARLERVAEPVDFNRLVAGVERDLATEIRQRQAEVVYKGLPTLHTSGELCHHVMRALIDNAIKFQQEDVRPRVEIEAEQVCDEWHFRVRDNGIGIAPDFRDKVFVLFQKLHARSSYSGTGVGLAVVQKTAQRLGGRVWFDPNPDGQAGVTFTFTLPAAPEADLTHEGANSADAIHTQAA